MRKLDNNEVIKRLEQLCCDKFSYDIDEYENTNKSIHLTCLLCGGVFERDLNALTYNNTCPFCNDKPRNRKYSTREFIDTANKKHNNKYDYSETEYIKTDIKVCVICHEKDVFGKEHGRFYVTPHSHIGKSLTGCPKCSRKNKKSTQDFINESNLIHNFKYNYSKTNYINAKKYVIITCPKHGDFKQQPNSHLMGQGCPVCSQSKVERKIKMFLEKENINFIPQYNPIWLKRMKLDFYLPDYNIGIEVQGLQHYKPIKYWGGDNNFKNVIKRDKLKKKLCLEHNIKLLYYSELNIELPDEVIKNTNKLLDIIKNCTTFVEI